MPICLRISILFAFGAVNSFSSTKTCPFVGCSNKFKQRKNVDFPEPDGPITATTSPAFIVVEIFFKTVCLPNFLVSFSTLITVTQPPFHNFSNLGKNVHHDPID